MELPESSPYSDTHPSSAIYQPNTGMVSRSSSNNVHAPLAVSIVSADDIDSLSFPTHPLYSDLFLASFQHNPGTAPTWLTPGMETPAIMPGNSFNHNNSPSLVDPGSASEPAPAPIQPNAMLADTYVSNGSRGSGNTVHPNAQDWKRHQALIAKLYAEHTLPELMKFMASEHGFRATIKMYKTRIKQWGLDTKNNREREMRAIVRIHKQRLDQGKRSIYRVAGRLMEYEDAVRYFRRKNIRIEDVIARRTSSPMPEAVQCFTPVLSPTNSPAAMSFTPIHRPIVTPQVLAIPERLLVTIWSYFRSSFESGTWKPTGGGSSSRRSMKITRDRKVYLNILSHQCRHACILFTNGYSGDAGKALDLAASTIGRILSADHPETLRYLFSIVSNVHRRRRIEIALSLLRQFSAMAEILLGREHPLCQISGWLTCVDLPQLDDTISRCGQSIADCFETFVGPTHPSTVDARIMSIGRSRLRGEYLQRSLKKCEGDLGSLNSRTLYICARLASNCFNEGQYPKAKEVSRELLARIWKSQNAKYLVPYQVEALIGIAQSQHALGEVYQEESTLRKAIDAYRPREQLQAMYMLSLLEAWLLERGQASCAAQARDRWRNMLRSPTLSEYLYLDPVHAEPRS